MTFQFPKDTHVTLPSVDGWGTNMNILKDPPKSLFTRKKDKVFETQELTDWVDGSGDRICEMINVYARGTNPMVSVSYQNSGGNGVPTGKQASLPYKVAVDGAFRPPTLTARDLLPLSRLPRAWTSVTSMPGFADYSKLIENPDKFRQVKEAITNVSVKPTAVFRLETIVNPSYDIKYYVNNAKSYAVGTNVSDTNKTQLTNIDPAKGIKEYLEGNVRTNVKDYGNVESYNVDPTKGNRDILSGNMSSNVSAHKTTTLSGDIDFRKEKYIHDVTHLNRTSAPTSYLQNNIHESEIDTNKFIQDSYNISHTPNVSGDKKYFVFEDEIELTKNVPYYNMQSNVNNSSYYTKIQHENELMFDRNTPLTNAYSRATQNNHENSLHSNSRDFNRLHEKPNAGSFHTPSNVPTYKGDVETKSYDEKSILQKKAYGFFSDRYDSKIPVPVY